MDEHLPYDEELLNRLNDLPLPDEDKAWEDMRRRLDKDDDGPLVPPVLKGCSGYALLLPVLLIIVFLWIDPAHWFHQTVKKEEPVKTTINKNKSSDSSSATMLKKTTDDDTADSKSTVDVALQDSAAIGSTKETITRKDNSKDSLNANKLPAENEKEFLNRKSTFSKKYPANNKKNTWLHDHHAVSINAGNQRNPYLSKPITKKTSGKLTSTISGNTAEDSVMSDPVAIDKTGDQSPGNYKDSTPDPLPQKKTSIDSIKTKKADTVINAKKPRQDSSNRKMVYFSAGLAVNQLIPVAGQKSNPYNSLGRKHSVSDYIPSVYLRMYKEKKWFAQAEFRYGAPQYAKEIVFNERKIIDTGTSSVISTNSSIKKTYYHQLPISFNYFVLPDLSLGVGVTFNKFQSALIQQDIHKANLGGSLDSLVSSGLVDQKKPDSNFVTTYMQALVEAQYRWRRFSIGARYAFGIQPYLKFKLPGGEQRNERNSSLQIFIRYELWRSKKPF